MKVVYRDEQTALGNTSFSPSAGKPGIFVDLIKRDPMVEIFTDWEPLSRADLYLVHDSKHIDAILDCRKPNGFGNTLKSVADSLPYTSGSFYHAAKISLQEGSPFSHQWVSSLPLKPKMDFAPSMDDGDVGITAPGWIGS